MTAEPATATSPWTVGRLLTWTTGFLREHGIEEPRLAAEVLLGHALGCRRIEVYTRFEQEPEPDKLSKFRELVRRASQHEPIAYLVGEKEFYSLGFRVDRNVLIPRPETERLVECAVDRCRQLGVDAPRVLDVGTGSGCIAISILKQLTMATVVATDISSAALEVARFNAERHGVLDRLSLIEADGLNLPGDYTDDNRFHVLVSNPPYVTAGDYANLQPIVKDYEPKSAVTDNADGLTFYRMLAERAGGFLHENGAVLVEIGDDRSEPVGREFTSRNWRQAGVWPDRATGRERVMMFQPA